MMINFSDCIELHCMTLYCAILFGIADWGMLFVRLNVESVELESLKKTCSMDNLVK